MFINLCSVGKKKKVQKSVDVLKNKRPALNNSKKRK